jgi:hypothetical protein
MIDELRTILEQAERLSPEEQHILAERLARELEALAWERALRAPGSVEMLAQWRERILAEHEAGETEEIQGDTWDS